MKKNIETLHIYTRVSTNAQEEDGTSLESQKALGIKKANSLGFKHRVWNEGGASSNYEDFENRPVLLELMEKIKSGSVKHLWVYNNDRLSRNSVTAQMIRVALQKHGVTLYTQDGKFNLNNPQDRFLKTILDEVAQLDNAMRAERTRLGKLNRIRQGWWMGGPAPFGYQIKDKRLVPHPEESKWVEKIYSWYANKKSTEWIKSQLDKNGVATRHEKGTWTLGSIQKILQNTHHVGRYTYRDKKSDEVIQCECPVIINEALWNQCQKSRKKILSRRGQNNRTKRFYLLRNFMVCGHCGSNMAGRIIESKNENFYYCPRKERNWVKKAPKKKEKWVRGKGCDMVRSLNIPRTDKLVWDAVYKTVSNSRPLKHAVKKLMTERSMMSDEDKAATIKAEQNKQKRLEKSLKRIVDNIADIETAKILGKQDVKIAKKILKNLNEELEKTKEQIEQSKSKVRELKNKRQFLGWLEKFKGSMEELKNCSEQEKQEYLNRVVEKIDVYYDHKANEHELRIFFKFPLLEEKKDSGLILLKNDLTVGLKKNDETRKNPQPPRYPLSAQDSHRRIKRNDGYARTFIKKNLVAVGAAGRHGPPDSHGNFPLA